MDRVIGPSHPAAYLRCREIPKASETKSDSRHKFQISIQIKPQGVGRLQIWGSTNQLVGGQTQSADPNFPQRWDHLDSEVWFWLLSVQKKVSSSTTCVHTLLYMGMCAMLYMGRGWRIFSLSSKMISLYPGLQGLTAYHLSLLSYICYSGHKVKQNRICVC